MPKETPQKTMIKIVTDWLAKACIGIITFFCLRFYQRMEDIPVMQQRIENVEKRTDRLEGKYFTNKYLSQPAKHEEIFSLQSLLNMQR